MRFLETLKQDYSTTKLCFKLLDDIFLDTNGKVKDSIKFKINIPEFGIVDSKIPAKGDEKLDTLLFLPEGEARKGEGGLRTKGYFKFSYRKLVKDKEGYKEDKNGEWYIVDFDGNPVKKVDLPESILIKFKKESITYLPLITVITVVLNGEKFLEETIRSVINQSYPNVEYIIIDGGSTDGTLDIIRHYEDVIDYWVSEKDKGIYDAMNKGIDLAIGEWINFMNTGDRFYNERVLERIFNKKNVDGKLFIYGDANIYSGSNKFLTTLKALKFSKTYLNMFATRVVCHQAVFVNKRIIGKYDVRFRLKGELNWYYSLEKKLKQKDILKLNLIIVNYLLGGEGDKNFWENNIERWKVTFLNNNFLSFIVSIPFFMIPFLFRIKK